MSKPYHPYTPLESVLSSPSVRVLRAIRFFDWVYADELMVAMDATDADRDSLSTALSRLVKIGSVERNGQRYRITADGRAELDAARRTDPVVIESPARPGTEHLLADDVSP